MTDHRSPSAVLEGALRGSSEILVTTAALEMGQLTLADALRVTVFYRKHAPAKYERTAVRWLERLAAAGPSLEEVTDAAEALLALRDGDDSGLAALEAIAAR